MSPEQPRETAEYQAAVELEMWKESQEQMFENQVSSHNSLLINKQLQQFRFKLSQFPALLQYNYGQSIGSSSDFSKIH